ncbi:MAG TPA: hypothetical protein VKT81_15065 [Bryobacteraceae bacterium]|nr:hypothetical protein [Bryobacteraceae bacterium]
MNRILEGIFVIGCSLVGFAMGAPEGSGIRNAMNCSVQLIGFANENIASHTENFDIRLAKAKEQVVGNLLSSNLIFIK